jgi:hypothetical protein
MAVLGFLLFSPVTGTSGSTCDRPLGPLGSQSTLDGPGFASEDVSMGQVIDLLNQGNVTGASNAFYGPVHNFTHNADPTIGSKNESLAKTLCGDVIKLENDLDVIQSHATAPQLSADATKVRNDLDDGAVALGYPRPG